MQTGHKSGRNRLEFMYLLNHELMPQTQTELCHQAQHQWSKQERTHLASRELEASRKTALSPSATRQLLQSMPDESSQKEASIGKLA